MGKGTNNSSVVPKIFRTSEVLTVCHLGQWLHFQEAAICTNWPGMLLARVKFLQSVPGGPEALGGLCDSGHLLHDAVVMLAYFWEQPLSCGLPTRECVSA